MVKEGTLTGIAALVAVAAAVWVIMAGGVSTARARARETLEDATGAIAEISGPTGALGTVTAAVDTSRPDVLEVSEPTVTYSSETDAGTAIEIASREDLFAVQDPDTGNYSLEGGTTEAITIGDATYTGWTPTTFGVSYD